VIGPRESLKFGDRDQNPRANPSCRELLIGDQVVERTGADGEQVGSLSSSDE
jgi:hypothetical protein